MSLDCCPSALATDATVQTFCTAKKGQNEEAQKFCLGCRCARQASCMLSCDASLFSLFISALVCTAVQNCMHKC